MYSNAPPKILHTSIFPFFFFDGYGNLYIILEFASVYVGPKNFVRLKLESV